MRAKRVALRIFFSLEVLMFCYVYMYGKNSIVQLVDMQKEYRDLQAQLADQEHEICAIEVEIQQWNASSFYKEKIAREQLQMARKYEHVYYRAS